MTENFSSAFWTKNQNRDPTTVTLKTNGNPKLWDSNILIIFGGTDSEDRGITLGGTFLEFFMKDYKLKLGNLFGGTVGTFFFFVKCRVKKEEMVRGILPTEEEEEEV